jgi:ribosomal protein S12 methylthiotransferase
LTKYKIGVVSLGCDKNRIDTEIMLGDLNNHYVITNNPEEADIIIVNTCGFIESSKQESIDTILDMAKYKKKHRCKLLITTGCLSQRYGKELMDLMPEIDIMVGVNDYDKLHESIEKFLKDNEKSYIFSSDDLKINEGKRIITSGTTTAYIRIGEGCSNYCTYCIIPKIRGNYRSRKIEDILTEATMLAEAGVKEIIIVAQDTTKYGIDLYGEKKLPELLNGISEIEGIKWVRILYCYVEEITDELIDVIASNDKICKYLDMPIQHISDNILKAMGRRGRKQDILSIINKLRSKVENIVLRTTLIVGFPGESNRDFEELKDFVRDIKFDKLGVFKYSPEEDTPASKMENQVEEDIKESRQEELMLLQQSVSSNVNLFKIGLIYDAIIESYDGEYYVGRTSGMSPEIDGNVFVRSEKKLIQGEFIKVKITDTAEYDLIGDVYYESC